MNNCLKLFIYLLISGLINERKFGPNIKNRFIPEWLKGRLETILVFKVLKEMSSSEIEQKGTDEEIQYYY